MKHGNDFYKVLRKRWKKSIINYGVIKISIRNKVVLLLVGSFFIFLWGLDFYVGLEQKAYFNDFKKDTICKLEIIIHQNPTGNQVTVHTSTNEEIDFFRNMLVKNLNGNDKEIPHKERKIYDYNVDLKFFNEDETDIYRFTIYVDKEKIKIRPVIFKDRGESIPGGYYYILQDDDFRFYENIFEIWSYKEIKNLR